MKSMVNYLKPDFHDMKKFIVNINLCVMQIENLM